MTSGNDVAYFRRRVAQEQQRALGACEVAIRRLHLDLAARYAARAEEAERHAPA